MQLSSRATNPVSGDKLLLLPKIKVVFVTFHAMLRPLLWNFSNLRSDVLAWKCLIHIFIVLYSLAIRAFYSDTFFFSRKAGFQTVDLIWQLSPLIKCYLIAIVDFRALHDIIWHHKHKLSLHMFKMCSYVSAIKANGRTAEALTNCRIWDRLHSAFQKILIRSESLSNFFEFRSNLIFTFDRL